VTVAQAVSLYRPDGRRYTGPVTQAVSLYRPGGRRYTDNKGSAGCQPNSTDFSWL